MKYWAMNSIVKLIKYEQVGFIAGVEDGSQWGNMISDSISKLKEKLYGYVLS